jgi:hypothetical protein
VERARAREARNADVPLDLRVIGFEFRVVDRPVGEAGARDRAEQAAFPEVHLVEAPEVGGEVVAAAADHARVPQRREVLHALRRLVGRAAERLRARLRAVEQRVVEPVVEFVVTEVGCGEAGALLHDDDVEPGAGEFARHHAARGARSHHDEIDRLARLVLAHAHDCGAFAYGTKPG